MWTMLKPDERPQVGRTARDQLINTARPRNARDAWMMDQLRQHPRRALYTPREIRQQVGLNPYPTRARFAEDVAREARAEREMRRTGPNTIRTVRVQHGGNTNIEAEITDFFERLERDYMDKDFVAKNKKLDDLKNIDENNYDID